jgi:hypothetical protein
VNSTWGYQATQVLDPHGLSTELHYDGEGNLDWVQQDGGRRFNIRWDSYCSTGGPCWLGKVIGRVENAGSAGKQAVEYLYGWVGGALTLRKVKYVNEPEPGHPGESVTATYTYESYIAPTGFSNGGPRLTIADDRHFDGPMRYIRYSYRDAGCLPLEQPVPAAEPYPGAHLGHFYASPTAIAAEKDGATGVTVSHFTIQCFYGTRAEYNGLGGFRKFFYGRSAGHQGAFWTSGYQLSELTDFDGTDPTAASVPFERQNYLLGEPREIWDGRGTLTETLYEDGSGLPTEVIHTGSGDQSSYKYNRTDRGQSDQQDFVRIPNPYHHWLFSKEDERHKITTYRRNPLRLVADITYPDNSAVEYYGYNTSFNQVTTHTLPSGAVVHYDYNSDNLVQREWNSVEGGGRGNDLYLLWSGELSRVGRSCGNGAERTRSVQWGHL